MRARLAIAAALALSGCVAVVHDSGEYVSEPAATAIDHLHAGQLITVVLNDGSALDVTYRGSAPNELIVSRRETFGNKEIHYPFAQVKSVHYYRSNGEWIEPAPFMGPGFVPIHL
jgi:hypothetical protein